MIVQKARTQIAAIVLAAGGSTRMGKLKQLLPLAGKPMVWHAANAACTAGLAQVIVVVGARARDVQRALDGLAVEFVTNETWTEGMSTSIQAGLCALRPEIAATLVVLADQPALSPALLQTLVDRYERTSALIVAPFYRGRRGNPVLIDRALFSDLLAVQGDQGGRALFARFEEEIERLETDDEAVVLDVDTPDEYEELRERHHDTEAKF